MQFFITTFKMPSHSYPTRFSNVNYSKPKTSYAKVGSGYSPAIWNNAVTNAEKELQSSSLFKSKLKTKLLDFENEVTFFSNKRKGYFCFVFFDHE